MAKLHHLEEIEPIKHVGARATIPLSYADARTLVCSLITAFTDRLPEPPIDAKAPLDSQVDIFFKFDEQGRDETGLLTLSPRLRGASGGGVWEISEAMPGTLWTAEKNMRLVGIQSSAMHGEWFRAKAAEIALSALDDAIR